MLLHLALGTFVLLAASLADADTDRHTRTVPLPVGRAITLDITIGDVRIEGSSRADAMIEIVRHASTAEDLARIPIEITEEESAVRIRAVQADGATLPSLRTDVTLLVPNTAAIRSVRIVEGRLTLVGLHGEIGADVRRGTIEATDLQGVVRLETGIGDLIANRMRLSPEGLLRLRTFNGDVRLTLAERPQDARVMALALNGTISSEIPLTTKDTWGPRWGEATLGKGEPVISIDIVNGRIEIRVLQR